MATKTPTAYTSPLTTNSSNFTNSSLKSPPTPPASTPSPKMEMPISPQGVPEPPRAPIGNSNFYFKIPPLDGSNLKVS